MDSISGNEQSGLPLQPDAGGPITPSACGGVTLALSTNPELWDAGAGNGIDCITNERWYYDFPGAVNLVPGPNTVTLTKSTWIWRDDLIAPAATQWQTHNPERGGRMVLASGTPLFLDGGQQVFMPNAGSSFYRWANLPPSPDYTGRVTFVALANTDTRIAWLLRYIDNANYIRLEYIPATTTWNIVDKVAGVDTILDTAIYDLTLSGPGPAGGELFDWTLAGNQVNFTSTNVPFAGPYTTANLSNGPWGGLIIATAAGNLGFTVQLRAFA